MRQTGFPGRSLRDSGVSGSCNTSPPPISVLAHHGTTKHTHSHIHTLAYWPKTAPGLPGISHSPALKHAQHLHSQRHHCHTHKTNPMGLLLPALPNPDTNTHSDQLWQILVLSQCSQHSLLSVTGKYLQKAERSRGEAGTPQTPDCSQA